MDKRWTITGLTLVAAFLFFWNIGGYDLWPADEPRFGQIPREILQTGDWLVLRCNGLPYKEKPPLLFWTIAAVSAPFGNVSEWTARFPSGVAALVTVLFTFALASRLYGRRVGWWAAVMLMTMALFWWEARSVRTDMMLTCCMTAFLYAFKVWNDTFSRKAWWGMVVAMALGLLVKGPPALVFPALLIVAYYWNRGIERENLRWGLLFGLALVPVLCWLIPARWSLPPDPDAGGLRDEFMRQVIGRFFLGVSKAAPPWAYLVDIPIGTLPWSLFLPWVLPWIWKRRKVDEGMRLLLAWIVPAFIFFSISIGKRNVYLLPIYPAMAVLMARSILDLMDQPFSPWPRRVGWVWTGALALMTAGLVAIPFTSFREMWRPGLAVLAGALVACAVWMLWLVTRRKGRGIHVVMATQFWVMAILTAHLFFPALNVYKGSGDFCAPLRVLSERAARGEGEDYRLYTIGFSREQYIFYTRHFHEPVLTDMLHIDLGRDVDWFTMAQAQATLRYLAFKAVRDVPVADLNHPTDAEKQALLDAVRRAVETSGVDRDLAEKFYQALLEEMDRFLRDFNAPGPAFVLIQRPDWKWIVTLCPRLAAATVVRSDSIGQREMTLLANPDGVRALEQAGFPIARLN
ncbi:MAG TPA: glycosyltransferase family 39 protein [Candidatus Hydrogenedentes bacterium]|nr:glycosyltransferase family 39 protein [Candidatus Hydrogenedentota bacterium]